MLGPLTLDLVSRCHTTLTVLNHFGFVNGWCCISREAYVSYAKCKLAELSLVTSKEGRRTKGLMGTLRYLLSY